MFLLHDPCGDRSLLAGWNRGGFEAEQDVECVRKRTEIRFLTPEILRARHFHGPRDLVES